MFSQRREGSPGKRASQKRATAQAVLAAARTEFERVGFDAANVRAIAARAGVSAGTVIHHYGDKKVLLHAALFDDLETTLQAALKKLEADPEGELEPRLSALTRAVFAYYLRRPKLSRTLLKESLFADAPWAKKFTSQVQRVHLAIAALAERSGEVRKGTGTLFAVAYFSFFYFALIAWVQGGHPQPADLVDQLIRQHLTGLRAGSPESVKAKRRTR